MSCACQSRQYGRTKLIRLLSDIQGGPARAGRDSVGTSQMVSLSEARKEERDGNDDEFP